ncbi:MAG: PocR ligand-binding domain-containing protein [Lachnospirales bacterium]
MDKLNDIVDLYEEEESKIDIFKYFTKEKLENMQRILSKATGLAFVTVDFRGEPITENTFFTQFCSEVRKSKSAKERCKSSDAFGSIQAAVSKTASVYLCPCGLLEVAIPIIINDQYLGGFIGGQIRCFDAPENLNSLRTAVRNSEAERYASTCDEFLDDVPVLTYEKFQNIANLASMLINELCENALKEYKSEEVYKRYIEKLKNTNKDDFIKLREKDAKIRELELNRNPYIMLDALTTIYNMTIIEKTKKSAELVENIIAMFKYTRLEREEFVSILKELEYIHKYLIMKKAKFGEKIDFSIEVPVEVQMKKMPSNVLLPFVEDAILNSLLPSNKNGKVTIKCFSKNDNIIFEIRDTGNTLKESEIEEKYSIYREHCQWYYIKASKEYAKEKMLNIFGEGFEIKEEYSEEGKLVTIIWTELYSERIDLNV